MFFYILKKEIFNNLKTDISKFKILTESNNYLLLFEKKNIILNYNSDYIVCFYKKQLIKSKGNKNKNLFFINSYLELFSKICK